MRLNEIEDTDDHFLLKYKSAIDFAIEKFKKGIAIYRGGKYFNDDKIIYKNPSTRTTNRLSSNTFNYYTLWMDNNPQWASFPKRGKSLICSTNLETANSYGKPMVVVPLINCTIGVCPDHDLWYCFQKVDSLMKFSDWLNNHFRTQWPNEDNDDITYQQLIQKLKEVKPDPVNNHWYLGLEKLLQTYGNAEEVIREVLDPVENNFTLTTWIQFNKRFNDVEDGNEVWLGAPCLLIDPHYFSNLAAR